MYSPNTLGIHLKEESVRVTVLISKCSVPVCCCVYFMRNDNAVTGVKNFFLQSVLTKMSRAFVSVPFSSIKLYVGTRRNVEALFFCSTSVFVTLYVNVSLSMYQ